MLRLVAIVSALVIVAVAALVSSGQRAQAEKVIYPAANYWGTIQLDGAAPATANFIYAEKWNGTVCGVGIVYVSSTTPKTAVYTIKVNSYDTQPGCFSGSDPIIFRFKGIKAQQIPMFNNWGAQWVDLSFKSPTYAPCPPALCPMAASPVIVPPPPSR